MEGTKIYRSFIFVCLLSVWAHLQAAPPKLSIYHFDVNTGDATLLISPDGHGVLIDAGDRGRGINPIGEFLNRAHSDGILNSLDYVITTHYDADHIGGADELLAGDWYPEVAVLDRGNTLLPRFDRAYVESTCSKIDAVDHAENLVPWGTAPTASCPSGRRASCQIVEYFVAAEAGGKRREIQPGEVLQLDHGIELVAAVVNATDLDGDVKDVHFSGRRDDCASNDLSVGILVKYGDFRYLVAGDLTGNPSEDVADVEELLKDDIANLDVYHVNHHGSRTSSSTDFMQAAHPTVAIVSNGRMFNHPLNDVIEDNLLTLSPPPDVYLTNRNASPGAWQAPDDRIADDDYTGYDGMIELGVWRRSYRLWRWRDGGRMGAGERYFIRQR